MAEALDPSYTRAMRARRVVFLGSVLLAASGCASFDVGNGSGDAGGDGPAREDRTGEHDARPGVDSPAPMQDAEREAASIRPDAPPRDATGDGALPPVDAEQGDARHGDAGDAGSNTGMDAGVDAGSGDSGGPVMCGPYSCVTGQSCVAGACQFTQCTGLTVPGNYTRVIDAVAALGGAGGTICIGAGTFTEDVHIGEGMGPVTLQGVSADTTNVHIVNVTSGSLTVRGMQIDFLESFVSGNAYTLMVTASILGNAAVGLTACELDVEGGSLEASFDGVEMIGLAESSPELQIYQSGDSMLSLSLVNSYLHAGPNGLLYTVGSGGSPTATLVAENDVFEDNGSNGVLINASGASVTAMIYNNIVDNNGAGITVSGATGSYGYNALYDNGSAYGGSWQGQASDILTDPMLDATTDPPSLLAGSPCLGAGDPTHAPSHDFYGNPRGSHPDIGAVQSVP